MAVCINSAALDGIDATIIHIETRITPGVHYCIVGLPDESVRESLVRVESAISDSGLHMPRQRIVISMAPADIRKQGALFDLPVALSILAESGQIGKNALDGIVSIGELSLNGRLRPVRGVLSMALQAKQEGYTSMIIPLENVAEAALGDNIKIYGFSDLKAVVNFLSGMEGLEPAIHRTAVSKKGQKKYQVDFAEIQGQDPIKRAFEIAAAGGHNLLMIGPPASGKTMMAKRLPTVMPPLSFKESLEITRLYSISGKLESEGLLTERPFRTPHHTASNISLVGGGTLAQPGEVSLAHNGVLFLDELPEFERKVLEVLRQPLEERQITISRANFNNTYAAGFLFVAAMNPCPCGFFRHPWRKCTCTKHMIRRYVNRISGPLLDRIDLHIPVEPIDFSQLAAPGSALPSAEIRKKVVTAREHQYRRSPGLLNAQLTPEMSRKFCKLGADEQDVLLKAMEKHRLSARSYDRILKVARTIADLEQSNLIEMPHLAEAIAYRCLDSDFFAI